jgi:hypothetical protein
MHAKRVKAIVEKMGEREDHERNTKARRAKVVFLAISFPFPNSGWFLGETLLKCFRLHPQCTVVKR